MNDSEKEGKNDTILIPLEKKKNINVDDLNKVKNLKSPVMLNKFPWDESEIEIKKEKIGIERFLFKKIFDSSPDAIIFTDKNIRIKLINKKAETIFGFNSRDVIGNKISNNYLKNKKDVIRIIKKMKEDTYIDNYETDFIAQNGKQIHVHFSASILKNEYGENIGTLWRINNITNRKKTERKVNISKEMWSSYVENTDDTVLIADNNDIIRYINKTIPRVIPKEVFGKSIYDLIAKEHHIKMMETLRKVYKYGRPDNFEVSFIISKMNTLWFNIKVIPIKKEDEISNVILILSNISKYKRVEEKIRKALQRLKSQIKRQSIDNSRTYEELQNEIMERMEADEKLNKQKEKFQTLLNLMADPVVIIDKKGKFLEISDKVTGISGFKKEELIGKNFLRTNILTKKSKAILVKNLALKMLGMSVKPYEIEGLTKDRKKLLIEVNTKKIEYEGKQAALVTLSDITSRKKSEQEISNLKDYTQEILHSVKSGIVVIDNNLKVLVWNNYMEESYGLEKDQILAKNILEIIPNLKKENFDSLFNQTLKNGKTIKQYMVKQLTKNGIKYYNLTFAPRKDENSKIIGILMSWDDVTELAELGTKLTTIYEITDKMKLTLEESEILEIGLDAIQDILKFHHCSILLVDEQNNDLYVKAYRGYSKDIHKCRFSLDTDKGIVNRVCKMGKLLNVNDVRKSTEYINFSHHTKSEIALPIKIREKTIGVINVESSKLKAFNEGDEKLLSTLASNISTALSNINLYKKTERRANAQATLNRIGKAISSTLNIDEIYNILYKEICKVIDTKNMYIALVDIKKKKINFEFEIEKNKRIPKRKIKFNSGISEYIVKHKKPLLIKNNFINECKKLGIKPYRKDSKSWLGVPLISKGKAIGVISVYSYDKENIFDEEHLDVIRTIADQASITIENSILYENLEKNHKKLKKTYKSLKKMEKIKSDFLSITSHEFKTPLTIIIPNLNMFLDGSFGKITDFQKDRLKSIYKSVIRIKKMKEQTILVSKLNAGKFKIKSEEIQLDKLIKDIVKEMKILALNNNQEIKTHLKKCKINCGGRMISEVFENLISNAVKYSGENSIIKINLKEEKKDIHITVSDNGPGIAKEKLNLIFDRFVIAHDSLNHQQGTGLGLAITKEIIDAHKGKVWCRSAKGKGSTFHVTIPKGK